jgi:PAS domain-containing protein
VVWGLVDGLADGVVLTDDDGVLVLANQRAEEILAEIEATNVLSNEAETALAIRAQAHATFALPPLARLIRTGSAKSGATSQEAGTRTPSASTTSRPGRMTHLGGTRELMTQVHDA